MTIDYTQPTTDIIEQIFKENPDIQQMEQTSRCLTNIIKNIQKNQIRRMQQNCTKQLIETHIKDKKHQDNKPLWCQQAKLKDLQFLKELLPVVPYQTLNKLLKKVPNLTYTSEVPIQQESDTSNLFDIKLCWEKLPPPAYSENEQKIVAPI